MPRGKPHPIYAKPKIADSFKLPPDNSQFMMYAKLAIAAINLANLTDEETLRQLEAIIKKERVKAKVRGKRA